MRNFTYKLFTAVLICIFTFAGASAQKVSSSEAKYVAEKWYRHITKDYLSDIPIISVDSVEQNGAATVFRYTLSDSRFIWVSADKRHAPILAYNLEPRSDNPQIPEAYEDFIDQYSNEISSTRLNKTKSTFAHPDWDRAFKGGFKSLILEDEVLPMMEVTWGQGGGYREFTPENTPTGCVAVAMVQIMRHWEYPDKGQGLCEHSHNVYGDFAVNWDTVDLVWDEMPYNEPNERIAKLMFYAGIALHMNWAPAGSGAQTEDTKNVLKDNFLYNPNRIASNGVSTYGTTENFVRMLKSELLNGRPLIISGQGTGGHAFNFDGFSGDHFHVNWGWSGSQNGYFLVTSLTPGSHNFSESVSSVSGIFPGDTMMVDRPMSLRLLAGHETANLAWYGLPGGGLQYYKIYRDGEEVGTTDKPIYVDEGLNPDQDYVYNVSAVYTIDSIDYESARTPEVFCPKPVGIVLPYEENFENGFTGWTIKSTSQGFNWGTADELNMGNSDSSKFIGINSGTAGSNKLVADTLFSNQIDMGGMEYVKLSFDYVLNQWQDIDHLYLMYRVFDDFEWITFHELESTRSYSNWTNYTCYLPAEAMHERVQLGFAYTDEGQVGYGAGIDNIRIEHVTDPGRPNFTVSEAEACIGQEIVFTDASSGTRNSWYWDFGTGASPRFAETAGPHNVTYSSSGKKDIQLILNGLDEKIQSEFIEIHRPPNARFSKTINYKTVSFRNTSTDADAYIWDFGDGVKVTQEDPVHVYALSGNYLVKLIAINFICGNDTTENWVNIVIAGNENLQNDPEINIYPNPSKGKIHVDLKSIESGDIYLRIYNLTGKEILNEKWKHSGFDSIIEKDLTGLEPGIYFIEIKIEQRIVMKKIMLG